VRIVSLVPSITELLCDLDLSEQLVGRTGFCIHPWETVRAIPKVGGTKDLKFDRIRELKPTHVVVNVDENRKEDAEALAEFIPNVVVTHPLAPRDNLDLYRQMGREFDREAQAEALCKRFEAALSKVEDRPEQRVLYLIWRDPWMTISPETYISRTLGLFNWKTVPASTDERYPQVDLAAVDGDRGLLTSEPNHI
jgi:ABC-type Fe3+-hydroxamate transport system substrate-binding protein